MDDVQLNSTVDPRDAKALRAHHEDIVALLRLRPRTSRELNDISFGYRQRISELRQAGYVIRADRVDGRLFQYTLVSQPVSANGEQTINNGASPAADEVRTGEHSSANTAGRIGDSGGGSVHNESIACAEDVGNDQRDDRAGEEASTSTDDRGRTGLILGRWEDAIAGVKVDAIICDPPYSARTHAGHFSGCSEEATDAEWLSRRGYDDKRSLRRPITYAAWTAADVSAFVSAWSPRCRGWMAIVTDHVLAREFEARLLDAGRYVFAPLPFVEPGKCPRLTGDGPASWCCWIVVARPRTREFSNWGSLPGSYVFPKGTVEQTKAIVGGKPLALMRALVRDYTKPGDLVCDPCAGAASTLVAAVQEGRRCIGAEVDPETWKIGAHRLAQELSAPRINFDAPPRASQGSLFGGGQ